MNGHTDTPVTFDRLRELLTLNRSTRIFDESRRIGADTLTKLVELTRWCASGRNIQPLRYKALSSPDECDRLFPSLRWAGYYTDWDGPEAGQRPAAYLIQCLDTDVAADCLCDDGLQLEAISLGAVALGLRCCIIKAFDAKAVKEAFALPEYLQPRYVLALGYGAETVRVTDWDADAEAPYKYYRLPDGTHCVPKRPLRDIMI